MSARRGGIPGPESRTGLVRPAMSEAEFERLAHAVVLDGDAAGREPDSPEPADEPGPAPTRPISAFVATAPPTTTRNSARARTTRPAPKARRVQRMFAIEEELDKKLWLYAIHVGKDRSDVVNDLLRPVVASMVLYDSRDRRSAANRATETAPADAGEG